MGRPAEPELIALSPARGALRPPESVRPLRILLVTPRGKKEEASSQKPLFSMAIGVLVSITPPQHELALADELFGDPIDYEGAYDLVGITARTMNVTRAYEIADAFRRRGVPVVLGGVHVSFNYKARDLIVDEDWDKYTAHNLVVRCDGYDPLEYQLRYLGHFLGMYAWSAIFARVAGNRNKLVNLVTSLLFRRNLKDQIASVRSGLRRPHQQARHTALADEERATELAAD